MQRIQAYISTHEGDIDIYIYIDFVLLFGVGRLSYFPFIDICLVRVVVSSHSVCTSSSVSAIAISYPHPWEPAPVCE